MITQKLVTDSVEYALSEIEQYGLPTVLHFNLSLNKAKELAEMASANVNLAQVGAALMDIKLGEAFKTGRLKEHVAMGVEASRNFLQNYDVTQEELDSIINCIEAHHGAVSFSCVESEIVTSADCYRFMHPVGVLSYLGTLAKRGLTFDEILNQTEDKLEEKKALLSFKSAEQELIPYYNNFKNMFATSRKLL